MITKKILEIDWQLNLRLNEEIKEVSKQEKYQGLPIPEKKTSYLIFCI